MKKLLGLCLLILLGSFVVGQTFEDESKQSVYVLEQHGLGSSSMEHSLLYTPLARWEAAILFGTYADTILDRDPNITAACTFWDVSSTSVVYNDIVKSCQLGLLKGSNGTFNPYGSMTRGQLIIVVARMLSQDPSLELNAAYNYLLQQGIIKVDDRANSTRVPGRNEVYIMLARFLHNPSSSSTQPTKQTLLVRTYTKDPLFGNFVLYSQGSAVLLSSSTLLTNAHVVSDVNGDPTGFYEICRVDQIGKDPVCFSSAILVRVDDFEDLALLQLPKAYTQGQPVSLRTRPVKAGDTLTVVGFPYDGGTTITTTKGIVAGFESDMIKTDAAVNYGNSGGGAYDGQGNLIGVPTGLYGNIGYLVPVATIQSFLVDDSALFSLPTKLQQNMPAFMSFLQSKYAGLASATTHLTTDYFAIKDLHGFTVSALSEYKNNDIATASYVLTTSDKKTSISLDVHYSAGVWSLDDQLSDVRVMLEEAYTSVTYEQKKQGLYDWHVFTAVGNYSDKNALLVYYVYVKDGGIFTVMVLGSQSQASVIAKTQGIVSSITALTIPASSSAGSVSLGFVSLPVPSFASIHAMVDAQSNRGSFSYDVNFSSASLIVSIEECGCSLASYATVTIDSLLNNDLWFDEDVKQSGTFTTVDGFGGYYIDNVWSDSRVFRAVIKVADPYREDAVLSLVFQLEGGSEISDAHIELLKNYVKTIRINGKNPFVQ